MMNVDFYSGVQIFTLVEGKVLGSLENDMIFSDIPSTSSSENSASKNAYSSDMEIKDRNRKLDYLNVVEGSWWEHPHLGIDFLAARKAIRQPYR